MDSTVRVNTATLNGWIYRVIEPLMRKNVLLGELKKNGRIKYGAEVAAKNIAWNVSWMRRKSVKLGGPVQQMTFPNTSTEVQASLSWAGRGIGESIQEVEILINRGTKTRLYDLKEHTIRRVTDDFMRDYGLYLWQDGNQASNEIMGMLSMFGGNANANDGVYNGLGTFNELALSSGTNMYGGTTWWCAQSASPPTYAGLDTTLGAKVNDWNAPAGSAYPLGTGAYGYNYWSPMVINYNSTAFIPDIPVNYVGSTHCWETQYSQACNRLIANLERLQGVKVDLIMLDSELLAQAKDSALNKQRWVVSEGGQKTDRGYKTFEYNGATFASEYGVPANAGFAMTYDKLNLYSLHDQLVGKAEDSDIVTGEDLHRLSSYTQLWAESPAFFGALVPATSPASGT